jgi:hypothetical protein
MGLDSGIADLLSANAHEVAFLGSIGNGFAHAVEPLLELRRCSDNESCPPAPTILAGLASPQDWGAEEALPNLNLTIYSYLL